MSPTALDPSTKDDHTSARGNSGQSDAPLPIGLYVPTVAFFNADDSVDVDTTAAHATRLVQAGVAGIVTHGSNGEAVHLDHEERKLINRATKSALEKAGKADLPLIVGCGAQSTRETIQLCKGAAESGGTHALVLPPAYYGGLLSSERIKTHFRAVADASPIPILIYNFPGACSGLDLSSDVIIELAEHRNIVGVKLTCGNTGKLARVVAATASKQSAAHPFRTFGGSVDFTLQTFVVGGHGIIGGTGNIAPRTCLKVIELWEKKDLAQAQALQAVVARGDWAAIQGGFVAVKAALQNYYGYGGKPRAPCSLEEGAAYEKQIDGFAELVESERTLEK